MNKLKKFKPVLFILLGLVFGFTYTKLNSSTINGTVVSNDNTCSSDKAASCTLQITNSQGNLTTIDYSYCSLVEKYAPRGYVPKSIFNAKPGDLVEVIGRIKGSVLKICPGWIPPLQIKVLK